MPSLFVQISQALQAQLELASVEVDGQSVGPPDDLTVTRGRASKVTPADVKEGKVLIDVAYAGDPKAPKPVGGRQGPVLSRQGRWMLSCWAEAGDLPTEDAIDPVYTWAIRALMANRRLGGLSNDIWEGESELGDIVYTDSATIIGALQVEVLVDYHTRRTDPAARN